MMINELGFRLFRSTALFLLFSGFSCLAKPQDSGLSNVDIQDEMNQKCKLRTTVQSVALDDIKFEEEVDPETPTLEDIVKSESRKKQEESYSYLINSIDSAYSSGKRSNNHITGLALVYAAELGCKEEFAGHVERWFVRYSSLDSDLVDLVYHGFLAEKWHALFNEQYATNTNSRSRFKMRSYAFRESLVLDDLNATILTNSMDDLDISLSLTESDGKLGLRAVVKNMSNRDIFVMPHSRAMRVEWTRQDGVLLPVSHAYELVHSDPPSRDPLFLYPGDKLVRERTLRSACLVENIDIPYGLFVWPERPPTTRKCVRFGGVWVAMGDEEVVLDAQAVVEALSKEEITAVSQKLEKERLLGYRYRLVEELLYSKPVHFISKMGEVAPVQEGNE